MKINSIKKVNVVEEVYEQMKEMIISGEWNPGEKIPSENSLCELFHVSRNTIRNAIQRLKALGVLVSKQGQGTFLSNSIQENLVDTFIPIIYLEKSDILEILEFRKSIELESIALAATRGKEKDVKQIKQALDKMVDNKDDFKIYSIADYQFHLSIAKASQNSIFFRAMLRLKDVLYSHFEEMNRGLGPELSVENHKRIFSAIANRDPELAKLLLRENINQSINKLKMRRK